MRNWFMTFLWHHGMQDKDHLTVWWHHSFRVVKTCHRMQVIVHYTYTHISFLMAKMNKHKYTSIQYVYELWILYQRYDAFYFSSFINELFLLILPIVQFRKYIHYTRQIASCYYSYEKIEKQTKPCLLKESHFNVAIVTNILKEILTLYYYVRRYACWIMNTFLFLKYTL